MKVQEREREKKNIYTKKREGKKKRETKSESEPAGSAWSKAALGAYLLAATTNACQASLNQALYASTQTLALLFDTHHLTI